MSLFPAYSLEKESSENEKLETESGEPATQWLENSSFQSSIPPNVVIDISESSDDEFDTPIGKSGVSEELSTPVSSARKLAPPVFPPKESSKSGKHKRKATSPKKKYETHVENVYYEDCMRDKGNFNVSTLCSRARALYDSKPPLGFVKFRKVKKTSFQRYHTWSIDALKREQKKKDTVIKRHKVKETESEEMNFDWCVNTEEETKSKTQEFNEKLLNDPHDIRLWLDFVNFQDTVLEFQVYESFKDRHRLSCQRKLSIVEKAMEKNNDSMELLKLKLDLMSELLPADDFSNEVEKILIKRVDNIFLWKTFIMATQGSVGICTLPKVLNLYSKFFNAIRYHSRTKSSDERLLEMLFQCLIFLRHAGLWEQMWEIMKVNLSLNLNIKKEILCFQKSVDEKKIIGMEEVILTSKLPLNQLWLRVESLRERCHWISVSRDQLELVGDSRRFILPEDVADYVHPMISRESNFRIAVYFLLALKVPLLPTRNSTLKELSLSEFTWGVDSIEMVLPMNCPMVGEIAGHQSRKNLFHGLIDGGLTSGPQYLRFHPAQEPYIEFIREAFHTIAENLSPLQRTSIYIWWLRFERLLAFLVKDDPVKNDHKNKKLKSLLKEFLKREENRNNLHFYREFALIEKEFGRFDSCIGILETAIESHGSFPSAISNPEEKMALFSLYRVLIETLLDTTMFKNSHSNRIFEVLRKMTPQPNDVSSVEKYLSECVEEFLSEPVEDSTNEIFLPNLHCDIIMCYVYILYTKGENLDEILQVLDECLNHSIESSNLHERLNEGRLSFLQLYCETVGSRDAKVAFIKSVNDALEAYPNNFYVLSVSADIENELPSWKYNSITKDEFGVWRAISSCLSLRSRIFQSQKLGLTDMEVASVNKLLSLHRTFARDPRTRCCPLLWRMYMLLLRDRNLSERKGEEAYHESVAQCPWARCVYIDAAEVAPQFLTQIQDVIREKELRMHVTPEELDILRE